MILDFNTRTSLEFTLQGVSPGIQNSILNKLTFGRTTSVGSGRVLLFDWTAAYLETVATVSVANTGAPTLTNTAVQPIISFPNNSRSAPVTTMVPLALEVFLISQPAIDGQSRDGECVVTLNKSGPTTVVSSSLHVSGAGDVAHMHWSSTGQIYEYSSLVFSGIKQHGVRIVAMLVGQDGA